MYLFMFSSTFKTKPSLVLPWTVCPGALVFLPVAQSWSKTNHSKRKLDTFGGVENIQMNLRNQTSHLLKFGQKLLHFSLALLFSLRKQRREYKETHPSRTLSDHFSLGYYHTVEGVL